MSAAESDASAASVSWAPTAGTATSIAHADSSANRIIEVRTHGNVLAMRACHSTGINNALEASVPSSSAQRSNACGEIAAFLAKLEIPVDGEQQRDVVRRRDESNQHADDAAGNKCV